MSSIINNSIINQNYKEKINKYIDEYNDTTLSNDNKKKIYINTYILPLIYLIYAYLMINYIVNNDIIFDNNQILNQYIFLDFLFNYKNPIIVNFNEAIYKKYFNGNHKEKKNNTLKQGFKDSSLENLIEHLNNVNKNLDKINIIYKFKEEVENIKLKCEKKTEIENIFEQLQKKNNSNKLQNLKTLLDDIDTFIKQKQSGGGANVKNKNHEKKYINSILTKLKKIELVNTNNYSQQKIQAFKERFSEIMGLKNSQLSIIDIYKILSQLNFNIKQPNNKIETISALIFTHKGSSSNNQNNNKINNLKNNIVDLIEEIKIFKQLIASGRNVSKDNASKDNALKKLFDKIIEQLNNFNPKNNNTNKLNLFIFNNIIQPFIKNLESFQQLFSQNNKHENQDQNMIKLKDIKIKFDNEFRKVLIENDKHKYLSKSHAYDQCIKLFKKKNDLNKDKIKNLQEYLKDKKQNSRKNLQKVNSLNGKKKISPFQKDIDKNEKEKIILIKNLKNTTSNNFKLDINENDNFQELLKQYNNDKNTQIKNKLGVTTTTNISSGTEIGNTKIKTIGKIKNINDNIKQEFLNFYNTIKNKLTKIVELENEIKNFKDKEKNREKRELNYDKEVYEINKKIKKTQDLIKNNEKQIKELEEKKLSNSKDLSLSDYKSTFLNLINTNTEMLKSIQSIKEDRELDKKSDMFIYTYQKDSIDKINFTNTNNNQKKYNELYKNIIKYINNLKKTNKNIQSTFFYHYVIQFLNGSKLGDKYRPLINSFINIFDDTIISIDKKLSQLSKLKKQQFKINNNTNEQLKKMNTSIENLKQKIINKSGEKSNKNNVVFVYPYSDSIKLYLMKLEQIHLFINNI